MMARFSVTYEIVTDESSEQGDAASRGFIAQDLDLRSAVNTVGETASPHCSRECIETDEYPIRAPRWITVTNGRDWITGESESRSLHIPKSATDATRRRIARLFGLKVEARP